MPEVSRHHISSAVVTVLPARGSEVLQALSGMEGVEVYAVQDCKIVVVIEGTSTGMLGDCLTRISLLDGVIAASMVFEHVETEEMTSDDRNPDAA